MKQHLDKIKEKLLFYIVAKKLIIFILVAIISTFVLNKINSIEIGHGEYKTIQNDIVDITLIDDGILKIIYESNNVDNRAVLYITNTDKGDTKYKYIIIPNKEYIITLTEGDGNYKIETISVENSTDVIYGENIYINLDKISNLVFKVSTSDVNFSSAIDTIEQLYGDENNLEKIAKDISNFKYDTTFAYNVKNGNIQTYSPDVDRFLNEKTGVCIDAATALTAIFRYKGYESQLVYGYIEGNSEYHSWVRVKVDNEWITFDPTLNKQGKVENDSKYKITEYH